LNLCETFGLRALACVRLFGSDVIFMGEAEFNPNVSPSGSFHPKFTLQLVTDQVPHQLQAKGICDIRIYRLRYASPFVSDPDANPAITASVHGNITRTAWPVFICVLEYIGDGFIQYQRAGNGLGKGQIDIFTVDDRDHISFDRVIDLLDAVPEHVDMVLHVDVIEIAAAIEVGMDHRHSEYPAPGVFNDLMRLGILSPSIS